MPNHPLRPEVVAFDVTETLFSLVCGADAPALAKPGACARFSGTVVCHSAARCLRAGGDGCLRAERKEKRLSDAMQGPDIGGKTLDEVARGLLVLPEFSNN